MTRFKAHRRFEELGKTLRQYRDQVPSEAERFHQVLDDLEARTAERLGSWSPWISDHELRSLERSVERLAEVAGDLTVLLRHRRPNLESRVAELTARSRELRSRDPELAAWLGERCRRWRTEVRRLGALAQRANELRHSEASADALERELDRHHRGLDLLVEAGQLLAGLGSNLDTAALEGELPKLRQRLLKDGPTSAWRQRLGQLLEPVRQLEPPPPAVEPQEVEKLCLDLREWAELLASRRQRADELWKRAVSGPRDGQLDELYRQARELEGELQRGACEHRQQRLDALAGQIALLGELQRAEPELPLDRSELRPPLEELRRRPIEGPEEHAIWAREVAIVEVKFQDAIKDYLSEIAGYLERRIAAQDGPLNDLHAVPLSSRTTARGARLRQRLAALRQRTRTLQEVVAPQTDARREVREVFDGLREVEDMAGEISELQDRARQEVETLDGDRRSLVQRFEVLGEPAARLGYALPDLGSRIAALIAGLDPQNPGAAPDDGASEGTLETSVAEARTLGEELDGHEHALLEIGRRRLAENREHATRALRVLERAGLEPAAKPPAGEAPVDGSLPEITRAIERSDDLRRRLEARLEQAVAELDQRARDAAGELGSLAADALRPEARRRVERLRRDLDRPEAGEDPVARLEAALSIHGRAEEILAQVQRRERRALGLRTQLLERLRALHAADLRDSCPALADRIEDLLHGIPERPHDWSAAERQLELAATLLGRVEVHARRLAVAELEERLGALRRAVRQAPDAETEALLEEAAGSPDRFPDADLRRRVRQRCRDLPSNLLT